MGRVRGQKVFRFPNGWGGNRKHDWARRQKRRGIRIPVPHDRRGEVSARYPVHVTMRLQAGLPCLRDTRTFEVVQEALVKGSDRFGFRLVQFSMQTNHLHLIVEAQDRKALSKGMQGLTIRVAKALNKLWRRRGKVFAERYHDVTLRSPRQVRNTLLYVMNNRFRHGERPGKQRRPDPFSSGRWFDGWRDFDVPHEQRVRNPLPYADGYLLAKLWRRHGLLRIHETPASSRARPPSRATRSSWA